LKIINDNIMGIEKGRLTWRAGFLPTGGGSEDRWRDYAASCGGIGG